MDTQQPTYSAPFSPLGSVPTPPGVSSDVEGNSPMSVEDSKYSNPGWSWGGFMQWTIFAIGLRKYWYLLLILIGMVPFVGGLISIGVMIYFGIKGREMAAASSVFANKEQYIGFMKGIDHAGKVMFFVSLIFLALVVAIVITFASLFSGAMSPYGNDGSLPHGIGMNQSYYE